MNSEIINYNYENGEIQRIQKVTFDSWEKLDFSAPKFSTEAFERICNLYMNYAVPKYPDAYGKLVMYYLPEDYVLPADISFLPEQQIAAEPSSDNAIDSGIDNICDREKMVNDKYIMLTRIFRDHVHIVANEVVIDNNKVRTIYNELANRGCIRIVCGNLEKTVIVPVDTCFGLISQNSENVSLCMSAGFFIMDLFDCESVYDRLGIPFGMYVKDGYVSSPPLYGREAIVVRKNNCKDTVYEASQYKASQYKVSIEVPDLRTMLIDINGMTYQHGSNCKIYTKNVCTMTPRAEVVDIVIIGTEVVDVVCGGGVQIPSAGFVLSIPFSEQNSSLENGYVESIIKCGDTVIYTGYEDVIFMIQAGNSAVIDGVGTYELRSEYYDINHPTGPMFPPSLYPLDFDNSRAPRIVIGELQDGTPTVLWIEGAGKFGHKAGSESCGATLNEVTDFCIKMGFRNAINLDGGGSAQILIEDKRKLKISDRSNDGTEEVERAIPISIILSD